MKIALDWDDTFTRDPHFWTVFILNARKSHHEVKIVTFRHPQHCDDIYLELKNRKISVDVIATGHISKRAICATKNWLPDVWIDDSPEYIVL